MSLTRTTRIEYPSNGNQGVEVDHKDSGVVSVSIDDGVARVSFRSDPNARHYTATKPEQLAEWFRKIADTIELPAPKDNV